ncbi:lipoyl domain-containing protein [Leekyejoonella antrihumi]|uniref:Biotin attachment protein n=1 Tax=Leekyejoonella antrihumi TaxID=1660198 RepID=A0A563E6N7_9MICO|nr:lipoyl domain-containing protein [Leekyejoonella antrihumi]TWP38167.1 biotin attachment protein [Leekyejoonella antrihumi]
MTDVPFPVMSQKEPDAVGVVATWYVAEGEQVVADQLLAEVQLDKVDVEVPAPCAGTVHLTTGEGTEVAQGTIIATID